MIQTTQSQALQHQNKTSQETSNIFSDKTDYYDPVILDRKYFVLKYFTVAQASEASIRLELTSEGDGIF